MKQIILCLIILLCGCGFSAAQQESVPSYEDFLEEYDNLFSAEEPLHITLRFDVKTFKKTKSQDVYLDAEMTQVLGDNSLVSKSIQVKAGGTMRRTFCHMPPIWLNMGQAGIEADSHQENLRMNMVLPCKDADPYEPYVLKEYMAYKIYNLITPLSYRVRLVKLTIIDTGKGDEVTEEWAFIQEPDGLLTHRLDAKLIQSENLSMNVMNPEQMSSLSMFQYMIGNADYSVTGRYNLAILSLNSPGPSGFLPIPYDFDYSGLVNTLYAVPSESLGTTSVQERYYLGLCHEKEVHEKAIMELEESGEKIMKFVKDFKYLDNPEKLEMIEYLNSYFKESRESGFIDSKINSTCR
jgi:hypothetical protein